VAATVRKTGVLIGWRQDFGGMVPSSSVQVLA
jgi:hypothetical protein